MTPSQIKTLVQSRNPLNRSSLWYQLEYGEELGGKITPDVKLAGDVYIPMSSWVTGKCILKDVKIPYNTNIIALSVHNQHQNIREIGDFKLEKGFRIFRGVYVDGLIRVMDHIDLKARVVIGYELKIYGREHLTIERYKKTQKKKGFE